MSNFINKIKKDSVLKNIQDARIEAIDSNVVENSVNPVEGGAVFTALTGKQDTLTAGANISIDNGVISVVGQLGVDDYNDLDNKPIINQDLEAVGFTPVANTYYRHTSEGGGLGVLENNGTYLPENIVFDTSVVIDKSQFSFIQHEGEGHPDIAMLMEMNNWGSQNSSLVALDYTGQTPPGASEPLTDCWSLSLDFAQPVVIYATQEYVDLVHSLMGDNVCTVGWNGATLREVIAKYDLSEVADAEFTAGSLAQESVWNGVFIGTGSASQYVSGKIYFYDGEEYKAIDGSGSGSGLNVIEIEIPSEDYQEDEVEIEITQEQYESIMANKINTVIDAYTEVDEHGSTIRIDIYFKPVTGMEDSNSVELMFDGNLEGTHLLGAIYLEANKYMFFYEKRIIEANDLASDPSTGKILSIDEHNNLTWGDVEGTDILSTGETSGKVLSANGDGTSSWVSPAPSGIEEINLRDLGNWYESSLINVGGYASFMGTMTDDVIATLRNGYVAYLKLEFTLYKVIVMYKQPITDDNYVYYVGRAVDYTNTSEGGKLDDVYILRAVVGGSNKLMSIFHYANTLDLGTITAIPQGTGVNNINRANNMNNILYNPELNIQFNFTGNSKNFWVTAKKQLVDYTTKTAYFVVPNWYKYTLGATNTNTSDLHVSICVASGTYCDIRFNLYSDGLQEVKVSNINSESATSGQVLAADGSGGASWQSVGNNDVVINLGNVNTSYFGSDNIYINDSTKAAALVNTTTPNVYVTITDTGLSASLLMKREYISVGQGDSGPVYSVAFSCPDGENTRYVVSLTIEENSGTYSGSGSIWRKEIGTIGSIKEGSTYYSILNNYLEVGNGITFANGMLEATGGGGSSDIIIDIGNVSLSTERDVINSFSAEQKAQVINTTVDNVYIKVKDTFENANLILKRTKYKIIDPDDNPNYENTEVCFVSSTVSDDFNRYDQRYVLYYTIDYSDYPSSTTYKALLYKTTLGAISWISLDNSSWKAPSTLAFGSDFTYDFNTSKIKLSSDYTLSGTISSGDTISDTTAIDVMTAHKSIIVNGKRFEYQETSSYDIRYLNATLNGTLIHITIMVFNSNRNEMTFVEQDVNDGMTYTTTEPSAANQNGLMKLVVLDHDPATKYAGWLYYITQ